MCKSIYTRGGVDVYKIPDQPTPDDIRAFVKDIAPEAPELRDIGPYPAYYKLMSLLFDNTNPDEDVNATSGTEEGKKGTEYLWLSTELYGLAKTNKSLFEAVLAHEVGHFVLGHVYVSARGMPKNRIKEREKAADMWSMKRLHEKGYSLKGAIAQLEEFVSDPRYNGAGHPAMSTRLKMAKAAEAGRL
jgi:hypothetical protein